MVGGKGHKRLVNLLTAILLAIVLIWVLFPFAWAIICSLKPMDMLYSKEARFIPTKITLDNFRWVLSDRSFQATTKNSLVVSAMTATFSTLLALMGGYALARFELPGKNTVVFVLLSGQMLGGILLVIPLFVILSRLRLVNTYAGLVLAFSTFTVPFCTLMLRSFLANFPVELEEAAQIDGCNKVQAFIRVILPLSLPGIVAGWLFAFIHAWNDLLYPVVLTRNLKTMTVAVNINNMAHTQFAGTNWSYILAEGILATLPVVIMFTYLQQYLIQGMTQGALKA
jgi:ABC-type glycerol-3-phosphate transport system permease component